MSGEVDFNIKGKVIALTGAASGIGLETSRLLARQGAHLSICDVNAEVLAEKKEELLELSTERTIYSQVVDVRDSEQVEQWIEATVKEFGRLDGAVNLAGVIPKSINIETIHQLNDEDWKFVLDVNLNGVMHCMRAQLKHMSDGGSIVNAASICGLIGFVKNAAYTVSKHAVIGLTKVAAKEYGERGIRCNAIAPGLIEGPMQQKSVAVRGGEMVWRCHITRRGTPFEVGSLIAWLLCDQSQYISGSVQVIDGAWVC